MMQEEKSWIGLDGSFSEHHAMERAEAWVCGQLALLQEPKALEKGSSRKHRAYIFLKYKGGSLVAGGGALKPEGRVLWRLQAQLGWGSLGNAANTWPAGARLPWVSLSGKREICVPSGIVLPGC